MKSIKGIVDKIRILNYGANPLVRFSLKTDVGSINCLIAAHSLNFLADVNENMTIVIAGYYNSRKQFVVRRYSVVGKTQMMMEFEAISQVMGV